LLIVGQGGANADASQETRMTSATTAARPRLSALAPDLAGDEHPLVPVEPAAMDAAPCAYEFITTRAAFDALEPEWNALFDRAGRGTQVFQTFNWNWHWCNHYLDGDSRRSLAVVVGRQGGRMVMVWPLIAMRVGGLLQISWMGEPVTQYGDVLVENSPASLAQLSDAWTRIVDRFKPDVVRLARVREDAAIAPLMQKLGARVTAQQQAPYLDLSSAPDFQTYIERHSSHSRKKRRAAAKRLARIGPAFSRHVEGREAARLARAAVEMKHTQLKERGLVSPAFADQRIDGFFADAADGQERSPGTLVYALECDGEVAALDILFHCKDRVAAHILAYAAKFQKESVGVHLLEHAIEQAIADGYRTFDLLAPADEYKLRWADGMVPVTDWALPVTGKGAAYTHIHLMRLRPMMKALFRRLPGPVRRYLARRYVA
jgi:CelD/BcsL family acetyltransferase involved in cellulose biosynthesis